MAAPRILVIEDDDAARDALGCLLAEDGYAVRTAGSGRRGLACAAEFQPNAIVCDYVLPDISGLQVLRRLRSSGRETFIVMVTAGRCGEADERALRAEADVFLDKPVDLARLRDALRSIGPPAVAAPGGTGLPITGEAYG
jgi:two-component system OmpR family response regulator